MRIETQKQIVKAFCMMYEDTDMPLGELIEKLQSVCSPSPSKEKNNKIWKKVSDEQILEIYLFVLIALPLTIKFQKLKFIQGCAIMREYNEVYL